MQRYVEEYAKKPQETVLMSADSVRILEGRKKTSLLTLACWKAFFVDVFLPRGYPHSVSADYMSYQIWDTVQAFASSMTSALATEAVLRGAGVGDEVNTYPTSSFFWPHIILLCTESYHTLHLPTAIYCHCKWLWGT